MTLAKSPHTFLVDTGSSLSLIDNNFFNSIKNHVNYKFLSRKVQINTINSSVNFRGCIQLSFKIDKLFFKHAFFLIDIAHASSFSGIIGYDFLSAHVSSISPATNFLLFGDTQVPLLTSVQNNANSNTMFTNSITSAQCLNDKQIKYKVTSCHKTIIPPQEIAYINVSADISHDQNLLFTSAFNHPHLQIFESIHSFDSHSTTDSLNANSDNSISKVHKLFFIYVQNKSDLSVHINKNTHLGFLSDFSIAPQQASNSVNLNSSNDQQPQDFLNVIQASPEILRKRQNEFNKENIDLKHLTDQQQSNLFNLLAEHKNAFSSSLDTLAHTDLVTPAIKF